MRERIKRRDISAIIVSSTALAISLRHALDAYRRMFCTDGSKTAKAKLYDLGHFENFMVSRYPDGPCLLDVNASSIAAFLTDRQAQGEAPATVARRLATVRHLTKHLASAFSDFHDPSPLIRGPRVTRPEPNSLTIAEAEQVRALAATIGRCPFSRLRNHAIIETAFLTGLRCAELCNLTEGQLAHGLTRLTNVKGKGDRYDPIILPSVLRPLLQRYLDMRDEVLCGLDQYYEQAGELRRGFYPLFVSVYACRRGDPESFRMSEKTVWRVFHGLALASGVHMYPHRARHTFIKRFYEATNDIVLTSKAARHSQLDTTMRYAESHEDELVRGIEKLK